MTDAAISVIIPAFNQARYLPFALESVFAQTLPAIEVIVIDDGSDDDTEAVAKQFGGAIQYIRQDNAGPSAARNAGIRAATGDSIAFLDADDWWERTFLEELVLASQQADEPSLVYCRQTLAGDGYSPHRATEVNARLCGPTLEALIAWPSITCDAMLVKRSLLVKAGMFDEALHGHEDWDLQLRIAALGVPFLFVDKALAFYRMHATGAHLNISLMSDTVLQVLDKWKNQPGQRFQRIRRYAVSSAVASKATETARQGKTVQSVAYIAHEFGAHPAAMCGAVFRYIDFMRLLIGSEDQKGDECKRVLDQVASHLPPGPTWIRDEMRGTLALSGTLAMVQKPDLLQP